MTELEFRSETRASRYNHERHNAICARQVNDYWAQRGKDARARTEPRQVLNLQGGGYTFRQVIVSGLVNGMPRE
jgi:Uma2 family endonuclease